MSEASGRIALVTGANRGIGYEVCRQLALLGARVILTGRDARKVAAAASALRQQRLDVFARKLDVTDPLAVDMLRRDIAQDFGRLDILINNAGVYLDDGVSLFDLSLEAYQETMNINLFGPMMRKQEYGRIVNVTSGLGNIHSMGGRTAAYKMSKAGLNVLTRVVAAELRRTPNIKVNACDPGWVQTDMGGDGAPRTVEQGAETILWLATLPADGPTDGYFYDGKRVEW